VLTTSDPSRPQMDAYVTGGKHGDGAVFALELAEASGFFGRCFTGYWVGRLTTLSAV